MQDPSAGRYIVLYTFVARDENDVSVERGEFVTVLNRDDPDWFWVLRHCDGNEGFVPSGFVYPGHVLHSYATTTTTTTTTTTAATTSAETHSLGLFRFSFIIILINSTSSSCGVYNFFVDGFGDLAALG